ncbi:MAG: RsmD family RNA methyltransferase [Bacteroidaceae bacterium]|nr:RsmD family RNA methyltransferase [Bacteroidaceae bacterium]
MRVISGKYKRRTFEVPRTFKARPTTDFAKENLFNVLTNLIDFEECANVLDLFAGTGSISLEFVSRGCGRVISVEREPAHHTHIYKIKEQLKEESWIPLRADVFRYIEKCHDTFNLIFADPPYALTRLAELPDLILNKGMLAEGGMFILEHGKDHSFVNHPCFVQERIYGSVHFSFFEPKGE